MSAVATNVYCALRTDDPYTWTTTCQHHAHTDMNKNLLDNAGDTLELPLNSLQQGYHCLLTHRAGRLHYFPGKEEAHRTDKFSPAICSYGALEGCVILAYENIVWPD